MSVRRILTTILAVAAVVAFNACERTVTTVKEDPTPLNCFECHSDQDTRLVSAEGQYDYSIHASGNNIDRNNSSCSGCHVSEGFVARVTGGSPGTYPNPTAIHCFTCHAPHTNANFTLRVTAPYPLENGESFDLGAANLCVACHHARRDVNTYVVDGTSLSTHWGPHHSVQGDMLIGSNGYEYPGYSYEITNHRGVTDNGCKDCHFEATSNYRVGGHSFNMRYEDVMLGEEFLNTGACNDDCHGSVDDFDISFGSVGVQTETDSLMEELHTRLEAAGLVDAGGHPISQTVANADSAGAVWNFLMAEEDRSHGVHNKKYIQGLLISAIQYMDGTLSPMVAETPNGPSGGTK